MLYLIFPILIFVRVFWMILFLPCFSDKFPMYSNMRFFLHWIFPALVFRSVLPPFQLCPFSGGNFFYCFNEDSLRDISKDGRAVTVV